MAKVAFALVLTIGLLSVVAGCASRETFVEKIPPPNFNGPVISHRTSSSLPNLPSAAPARPPVASGGIPREWAPQASSRSWRWIVIHHSATPSGSARLFDQMHRQKGWDELGYHFVIGNGTDSGDGQIEVGPRWPRQKWGAHAKTPDNQYNEFGIGICLVGNFDIERPTPQQTRALARLLAHLMNTYGIPPHHVIGHGDTGKPTECPGRNMNIAAIRRLATQLAATGAATDESPTAASASAGTMP